MRACRAQDCKSHTKGRLGVFHSQGDPPEMKQRTCKTETVGRGGMDGAVVEKLWSFRWVGEHPETSLGLWPGSLHAFWFLQHSGDLLRQKKPPGDWMLPVWEPCEGQISKPLPAYQGSILGSTWAWGQESLKSFLIGPHWPRLTLKAAPLNSWPFLHWQKLPLLPRG